MAAFAFLLPLLLAPAGTLAPGDPAPALGVKRWLQGEPMAAVPEKGVAVVEFWATWCGPCREAIPHLNELAKKNPSVAFLGVSVWEDDGPGLDRFVKEMGDKMTYRVGYAGNQDGMAATWLTPAAQNGIPTSFLVKDGTIQWVGHPMTLEEPLKKVLAGTWDVAASRRAFEAEAAEARRAMEFQKRLAAADKRFEAGERDAARADLDAAAKEFPGTADQVASVKFGWLAQEDPKAWRRAAARISWSPSDEERQTLRGFAINAAVRGNKERAREATRLLLASRPDDATDLWYAVNVYERTGDAPAALAVARRLLAGFDKSPYARSAAMRKNLQTKIAAWEAATPKKDAKR